MSELDSQRQALKDAIEAANSKINRAIGFNKWGVDYIQAKAGEAEVYHLERAYRALKRGEPVDVQAVMSEATVIYEQTLEKHVNQRADGARGLISLAAGLCGLAIACIAIWIIGTWAYHALSVVR